MKTKKVILTIFGLGIFLMSNSLVLANECSDGLIWNETIKDCLNAEDDNRVNEKQRMCDSKAEGSAKDECNQMVQSFDKDPAKYVSTTKVDTSKKEKSLKKIGTAKSAVSAGIAAYKLFEAYNAAKSAKDVFSNMCMSGMLSIATGVMSFMNDKNMDKQVKQTLKQAKDKLKRLLDENKRTKGTSYEMQIKLMQAYKEMLDAGAQAAGIREDGYKQEVTMYSISLGIAAIEIAIYSIPPVAAAAADKIKCASWVAGSAAISLVLGNQMKKAASSAKSKYESESEKLGKILKKYMDFFNKKHIDQMSLATKMAVNGSAGAPINAKNNNEATNFNNKNLTEAEKNMCEAAPSTECCNDSGKKCPTFNVSISNPTIAGVMEKAGIDGILDRGDQRLKSNLGTDDGTSKALDRDLKRSRAFKQRVLKQLADQGKLTSAQAELFDEKKQMKAFLKKQFGNENVRLGSSFNDNMALPDSDRISKLIGEGDIPKELKEEKKKSSSSFNSLAALSKINNSLGDLDLEDEDDASSTSLNGSDNLAMNAGLDADEEYVYDREQIVEKPEVSIFQVISNRYNVLRINKRFGQRASK